MVKKTYNPKKKSKSKSSKSTKWQIFCLKIGKNQQKTAPHKHKITRDRKIDPRKNNRMIYFNLARPTLKTIRKKRREAIINRLNPIYDRVVNNQTGSGLGSNLVKARFDLGAKALGSEFGKKLINKGIDNMPNLFKFGASKIKNKNVKRALNSEIADLVVNKAQGKARKKNNSSNLFG